MKYSIKYFKDGVSCLPFLLASTLSQLFFSSSLAGFSPMIDFCRVVQSSYSNDNDNDNDDDDDDDQDNYDDDQDDQER